MRLVPQRTGLACIVVSYCSLLLLTTGCAQSGAELEPAPGTVTDLTPAEADAKAARVRRQPLAYLHTVADKCRALEDYTLIFTRHERRGLLVRKLYGPERIKCWFRKAPFSVRMHWLDDDVKYLESVYIEGEHDNKVRFVTRWWSPPLLPPPNINKVDLKTSVIWGESKRPLSDFGLANLIDKTLTSLAEAGDDVTLTYRGLLKLPDDGPTVHHLHLEYLASTHKTPTQELYINIADDLPAGTILKLPTGDIDAAYFYANINTNVNLTDEDFLLKVERHEPNPEPDQPPATTPAP